MSRPKSLVLANFDDAYMSALDALMASPLSSPFRKFSNTEYLPRMVHKDEDDNRIVYTVELPGYKEEDIKVTMENDIVTIEAKREQPYKAEINSSFTVGEVDIDAASGNLENGILTLIFPKREDAKPRRIPLK